MFPPLQLRGRHMGLFALVALATAGCSVRHYAVSQLGDALARSSGSVFASDNDPALIREAAPFSLKLTESLLAENPRDDALLLAAARGFTQYAYAFVQEDADELEPTDFAAAQVRHERARRLYLRARDYGLRGLEVRHPGFTAGLTADPARAVTVTTREDVPLLYWTAAAWGGAVAQGKDRPELIAELPQVDALIDRAVALDADWDNGTLQTFLITYAMARGGSDAAARSRRAFDRAVALSHGRLAAPYVNYAEAVPLQRQQSAEFRQLLQQALAIDVDADPPHRLENLIEQRRARWLLGRMDELFLNP